MDDISDRVVDDVALPDSMMIQVKDVEGNLCDLVKTYQDTLHDAMKHIKQNGSSEEDKKLHSINVTIRNLQEQYFLVQKDHLRQLSQEIKQLKDTLPKVVNKEVIQATYKFHTKDLECKLLSVEKQNLEKEHKSLKCRHDATLMELEKERKDNLQLLQQIKDMSEAMQEQSSFWTKFGGSTCNLLWRASDQDESIVKMCSGEHGVKFMEVATYALESYHSALREYKFKKTEELQAEHQFVFSLTGFLTNITASSFGREYIMSSSHNQSILDTLIQLVTDVPSKELKWAKFRNLLLKILYNLSLNDRGLSHLIGKQHLFRSIVRFIEDEKCMENKLQSIRLIHSILLEPENNGVVQTFSELISAEKMTTLIQTFNGEAKSALQEMSTMLCLQGREQ